MLVTSVIHASIVGGDRGTDKWTWETGQGGSEGKEGERQDHTTDIGEDQGAVGENGSFYTQNRIVPPPTCTRPAAGPGCPWYEVLGEGQRSRCLQGEARQ